MDAIELDLDTSDPELLGAIAVVVRSLEVERLDLADPLTAIEADRRIADELPDAVVHYENCGFLNPPVWRIRRGG
jgi:hypothetical protein